MAKVIAKSIGNASNRTNDTVKNGAGRRNIIDPTIVGMDDNNHSVVTRVGQIFSTDPMNSNLIESAMQSVGLYGQTDIDLFNNFYRFGVFNPYGAVSNTREFIFFTKPDLYILEKNGTYPINKLRPQLEKIPFWQELLTRYPQVIYNLQGSCKSRSPFNLLLGNQVNSNLDIPSLSAETIDTPTNMYGVNFSYRGTSEASNDSFEFSLEFKDTRYLPIYMYFRAYEEYETLKHHGLIWPYKSYIENKIIHDQFAIYKFLVDEDMETILYFSKYYGVMPKDLPRDVFSSSNFDSGLTFSIGFKAAFFDDMDPLILDDFNAFTEESYNNAPYRIDIYNDILHHIDNRPATTARIFAVKSKTAPGKMRYVLKWKGYER